MKPYLIALTLFVTSLPVSATPRKHFYTSGKWWIGEAVIGLAVGLDMHSTSRAIGTNRGVEQNDLLGPHPSNGKIAAFGLGAFAYWTTFHAIDWNLSHEDRLGWRIVGYSAIPVAALATHLPAAIHNYEIPAAVREGLVRPE